MKLVVTGECYKATPSWTKGQRKCVPLLKAVVVKRVVTVECYKATPSWTEGKENLFTYFKQLM